MKTTLQERISWKHVEEEKAPDLPSFEKMAKKIVDVIRIYGQGVTPVAGDRRIAQLIEATWGERADYEVREDGIFSGDAGEVLSWRSERRYLANRYGDISKLYLQALDIEQEYMQGRRTVSWKHVEEIPAYTLSPDADRSHTSLQAVISGVTIEELQSVFGEPIHVSDDANGYEYEYLFTSSDEGRRVVCLYDRWGEWRVGAQTRAEVQPFLRWLNEKLPSANLQVAASQTAIYASATKESSTFGIGTPQWTNDVIVEAYGRLNDSGIAEPTEEQMLMEIINAFVDAGVEPTTSVRYMAQQAHDRWLKWFTSTKGYDTVEAPKEGHDITNTMQGDTEMKTATYYLRMPSSNGRVYFQRFAAELNTAASAHGLAIGIQSIAEDNHSAVLGIQRTAVATAGHRPSQLLYSPAVLSVLESIENKLAARYMLAREGDPLVKMADDISDRVAPMGWQQDSQVPAGNPGGENAQPALPPQQGQPEAKPLYDSTSDSGKKFNITVDPTDKSVNVKFLNSEEETALDQALDAPPQYDKNVIPDLAFRQQGQPSPGAPAPAAGGEQPSFENQETATAF